MKKYKIFDVVELNNENKATILDIEKDTYKVEVVNKEGISLGITNVFDNEINKIIISK